MFADYRIRAYNRLMSQLRRKTRCPLSIICILPLIMHSTATTPLVVLPRSRRERGRLPKKCTSHSFSWPWPWPCLASKVDFDHFCSFFVRFPLHQLYLFARTAGPCPMRCASRWSRRLSASRTPRPPARVLPPMGFWLPLNLRRS